MRQNCCVGAIPPRPGAPRYGAKRIGVFVMEFIDNGDGTFTLTGPLQEVLSKTGKSVTIATSGGRSPIGQDADGRALKATIAIGYDATPEDLLRLCTEDGLYQLHDPATYGFFMGAEENSKPLPSASTALRHLLKYREESGNPDATPADAAVGIVAARARAKNARTAPVGKARPLAPAPTNDDGEEGGEDSGPAPRPPARPVIPAKAPAPRPGPRKA